jgi:hypothetical protein
LINKQISTVKSKLLKDTDDLEQRLITEVTSVQEIDEKIMRETNEMSHSISIISSSSLSVSESKDEALTSFDATSNGMTVSQDL